ncbi:hypothetical protein OS493_039216 [Desmophyllum pertusum]|uniref:ETS domain-containing protein n=1 Tax=Desmophyllum pertusum TaxID=174260 RepID=A0A9W9ZUS3_9CNID|nr:hypothetical protein OS493_039216 [Desmophyllum pertusum]
MPPSAGNNGQIQLWQFLLELLTDRGSRPPDHVGGREWFVYKFVCDLKNLLGYSAGETEQTCTGGRGRSQ